MDSNKKVTAAKVFSIIELIITVTVLVLAAVVIINIIVCRAKNKPVSFFGVSFAIVQTQSMEPFIMTGDLILFKPCNYADVKVGDYIVFTAGDGFGSLKGQNIVHEAIEITDSGIVTQGKNISTNKVPDKDLVTVDNLIGICTFNSSGWGKVFSVFNKYGIILVLAIIILPLVFKQILLRKR